MPKHAHATKVRRTALKLARLHTDTAIAKAEAMIEDFAKLEKLKQRILELNDACSSLEKTLKSHRDIDEKDLRVAIDRVRKLEWAWAFTDGLKEGFSIAQQQFQKRPQMENKLKQAKGQWRALKVMVKILRGQLNMPTAKVFEEMDNRRVPIFAYGGLFPGPTFHKWSDVAQEPVFKNLVTKARNNVRLNIRSQRWDRLLNPPGQPPASTDEVSS